MRQVSDLNLIEEELLIIRHSGEIPEVALHGSIFFLTRDPDGPKLTLDQDSLRQMKEKVVERYLEIIARDLEPENRSKSLYRGLARCAVNWQRMAGFCSREDLDLKQARALTAKLLISFIKTEKNDVGRGRTSSINCCRTTLARFAESLGLAPQELPAGWQELCREDHK